MSESNNEKPVEFDFDTEMCGLIRDAVAERISATEQRRPEVAVLNDIIDSGSADAHPVKLHPDEPVIAAHDSETLTYGAMAESNENEDFEPFEDAALKQAKSRITFLEEESARFARDHELLRQSLNQAHAENQAIAQALNAAREKGKRAASEAERRLSEHADALNTAMESVSERENQLETANASLAETLETLTHAQARVADLESITEASEAQIESLSATVKDLEAANLNAVQELDAALVGASDREKRVEDLLQSNNALLDRARRSGFELVGARGVVEAARRLCVLRVLPDGSNVIGPTALQALFTALGLYDASRDASFVLDDVNAEIEAARDRAVLAELGHANAMVQVEEAEQRAASATVRAADRFAHREFELKKLIRELQDLCRSSGVLLSKMQEWEIYAEKLEQDANAAMAAEIRDQRRQVSLLKEIRTRADLLAAAVSAGLDEDHGVIKRAWLHFMTGRDEDVGSKSFAELHEMVFSNSEDQATA